MRGARPFIWALAAGELIADKMPGIPDRVGRGPLIARALMGGLVAVASRPRRRVGDVVLAVALGAAAASASAVLAFSFRRQLGRWLGGGRIANVVSGSIEDGLAVAGGRSLTAAT